MYKIEGEGVFSESDMDVGNNFIEILKNEGVQQISIGYTIEAPRLMIVRFCLQSDNYKGIE